MRVLVTFLILLLIGLLGYGFFTYRGLFSLIKKNEREMVEREKEILSLYEKKLADLEVEYQKISKRGENKEKLIELDSKIKEMREVIKRWGEEKEGEKRESLYRMCVEIYRTTSGICRYLREE